MKRCPDCGKHKAPRRVPANKRMRDGRHAYCKLCHNARGRESKDRLYGGNRHYHLKRRLWHRRRGVRSARARSGGPVPDLHQTESGACRPRSRDRASARHSVLQLQRRTRAVRRRHRTARARPALPRVVGHDSRREDAIVGHRSTTGARVAGECGVGFGHGVAVLRARGVEPDAGAASYVVPQWREGIASAVRRRAQGRGRRARGAPAAATVAVLAAARPRSLRFRPCRLARR